MSEQHHDSQGAPDPHDAHGAGGAGVATADAPIHVDIYESAWIRISVVVLIIFFLAIGISAFSVGFQVPGVYQRIDPATLYDAGSPFANPELRELAPGKYEVHIRAQIWFFTPREIRVPAGSTITFYTTSQDVVHGVKILGTNVNMMILPGQVSTLTAKFDKPGTYNFICHEYCGLNHHTMYGQIIVEDAPAAEAAASSAVQ